MWYNPMDESWPRTQGGRIEDRYQHEERLKSVCERVMVAHGRPSLFKVERLQ